MAEEIEVKVTSMELIKPSTPTPPQLRTFKLSLLDQLIPATYAPMILFYCPGCSDHPDKLPLRARLDLLKVSLSRTLVRFYPLAGKIRDDLFIDCDDGGVHYVEACVDVSLSGFLEKPDLVRLQRLLPCELVPKESSKETQTANIQVNVFRCGGIAIGICISHKILDGAGLSGFLKEWAAESQGGGRPAVPSLVAAADLFPADDLWLRDSAIGMWRSLFKMGKSVTKRFVFDRSAIEALKARGTGPNVKSPTRVEAVSGFLWKCAAAASCRKNNGGSRPSFSTHLVNFRNWMSPPSPEQSLGNLLWIASTKLKSVELDSDQTTDVLPSLVSELRGAISNIDSEFVSRLRHDKDLISGSLKEIGDRSMDGVDYFGFSSWCRFGYYDVDFGWGRPVWVSSIGTSESAYMNLIILVDTRSGDGIEAWVTLDEQDMALVEAHPEVRSFTVLDPNPLMVGELKCEQQSCVAKPSG